MSSWGKCDFSDLRDFANRLEKADMDDLCVSCAKELAARLLSLVIPETPVGEYPANSGKTGGTLRRGWGAETEKAGRSYAQSLSVTKSGDNYTVEVINPVEYASYVEFGHRTVNGGWVEGKKMLTVSEEKLKRIAPYALEKMILRKLKEFCNGAD